MYVTEHTEYYTANNIVWTHELVVWSLAIFFVSLLLLKVPQYIYGFLH